MRGLWLENQLLSYRHDLPQPHPAQSEALIRLRLAGVYSIDLELLRGYYPFTGVPGHEFVGDVLSSPSDRSWEGQRVVGEINVACGQCPTCRSGLPRHCERRKTLGIHDWNGVFAESLILPLVNLHAVPASIPDQAAVFAEPLAAAYEILDQHAVHPGEHVLIVGAGRLGQLIAQVLHAFDCQLEVLVRHARLQELLARREIRTLMLPELGGKKFDVVIEATGSPDGFAIARQAVRPYGRIVLKSTYTGELSVDFSSIVVDEITLVGSRCGPFGPALQLLAEGKVNPLPLIDAVYPLDQGLQAFEHAARPGVLKVLLQL